MGNLGYSGLSLRSMTVMYLAKRIIFLILFLPIFAFSQAKMDTVSYDQVTVSFGDIVPDFSAMDETGKTHTLSDLRGNKNLVLIFYRGFW